MVAPLVAPLIVAAVGFIQDQVVDWIKNDSQQFFKDQALRILQTHGEALLDEGIEAIANSAQKWIRGESEVEVDPLLARYVALVSYSRCERMLTDENLDWYFKCEKNFRQAHARWLFAQFRMLEQLHRDNERKTDASDAILKEMDACDADRQEHLLELRQYLRIKGFKKPEGSEDANAETDTVFECLQAQVMVQLSLELNEMKLPEDAQKIIKACHDKLLAQCRKCKSPLFPMLCRDAANSNDRNRIDEKSNFDRLIARLKAESFEDVGEFTQYLLFKKLNLDEQVCLDKAKELCKTVEKNSARYRKDLDELVKKWESDRVGRHVDITGKAYYPRKENLEQLIETEPERLGFAKDTIAFQQALYDKTTYGDKIALINSWIGKTENELMSLPPPPNEIPVPVQRGQLAYSLQERKYYLINLKQMYERKMEQALVSPSSIYTVSKRVNTRSASRRSSRNGDTDANGDVVMGVRLRENGALALTARPRRRRARRAPRDQVVKVTGGDNDAPLRGPKFTQN